YIMKAVFPPDVDLLRDALKLVHLSNGFKMTGNVCTSEVRVVSVINPDSGKSMKVKGAVLCNGKPIINVTTPFIYRESFFDNHNAFKIVDEFPTLVDINSRADIAVLKDKEWYDWSDKTKPLLQRTRLFLHTRSLQKGSTYLKVSGAIKSLYAIK
ncbi:hypothetical protein M407DRAFT_8593, partial [Tulasnella calospora MUT 4182]